MIKTNILIAHRNINQLKLQGDPKSFYRGEKLNIFAMTRPNGLIFLPIIKTCS